MKKRINQIKGKRLVQGGDTNTLTHNEILVTETSNGVSLKERTSDGVKELSGSASDYVIFYTETSGSKSFFMTEDSNSEDFMSSGVSFTRNTKVKMGYDYGGKPAPEIQADVYIKVNWDGVYAVYSPKEIKIIEYYAEASKPHSIDYDQETINNDNLYARRVYYKSGQILNIGNKIIIVDYSGRTEPV